MDRMKYQAILSIHVSVMIAATGCSGPLQSIKFCHGEAAPSNALIRDISWLRHQSSHFENTTLGAVHHYISQGQTGT